MRWFLVVMQLNSTFEVTDIKPIFTFNKQSDCVAAITQLGTTTVDISNVTCIEASSNIPH